MKAEAIPDGWMGLDIGPDSVKTFNEALDTCKTVIWNGPMGVFEFDKFAVGTEVSNARVGEWGWEINGWTRWWQNHLHVLSTSVVD